MTPANPNPEEAMSETPIAVMRCGNCNRPPFESVQVCASGHYVWCSGCGETGSIEPSEEEAIAAWNRRPATQPVETGRMGEARERLAKLVAELEKPDRNDPLTDPYDAFSMGEREKVFTADLRLLLSTSPPAEPLEVRPDTKEAREIIEQLLEQWPEGSAPSGPLCVRAAKIINSNPTVRPVSAGAEPVAWRWRFKLQPDARWVYGHHPITRIQPQEWEIEPLYTAPPPPPPPPIDPAAEERWARIMEENLLIERHYDGQKIVETITGIPEAARAIIADLTGTGEVGTKT